jgi:hypothetical protein
MRILTGDECGILKECLPEHKKEQISCLRNEGSRRKGVVGLDWAADQQHDDSAVDRQFASLQLDSTVTLWERSDDSKRSFAKYHSVRDIRNVFTDSSISDTNRPLGLAAIVGDRFIACNTFGQASILKPLAPEPIIQRFSTIAIPDSSGPENKHPLLSCMAVHAPNQKLALGGQDRETVVFDIESTKQLFKCKNLPPHPQTLLTPLVWPTCIEFMGVEGNLFAVGTAHHEVRLYDTRVARRPVQYTPEHLFEYRVTALCHDAINHEHDLFVGDAAGTILKLDLRALGRGTSSVDPVRYAGPAGSVRQLAVRDNKLAAVGLDRMLRIYNIGSTKEVHTIYMKQRLNCLLLGREPWKVDSDDADDDDGDIDQEDVVRDYVDSDDDGDMSGGDDDDGSSSGDDQANDDEADDSSEGDSHDSEKVESEEDASLDGEADDGSDSADESESDKEESVSIPPAKKRQKR